MKITLFMICLMLAVVIVCPAFAGPTVGANGKNPEQVYQEAIAHAKNDKDKALLMKKLGDLYVSREDYQRAAEAYALALSLYRGFSEQEKTQMAVFLSWADKLDDAAALLRSVLSENPKNGEARVHLARALSWSGKLREAEDEADKVLRELPENGEALLIKANILRWKGDAKASMPLYEKILTKGEDFDARLGLAYAYLDAGDRKHAAANASLVQPRYAYQVKELNKFQEAARDREKSPADGSFIHYSDSDGNRVNTYSLSSQLHPGDWTATFGYRHVDAVDPTPRSARADEVSMKTYHKGDRTGAGAGVSAVREEFGQTVNSLAGHLTADVSVPRGTIGATASKDVLTDTAQLIQNRIFQTSGTLRASGEFPAGFSAFCSYQYSEYSDVNRSQDVVLRVNERIVEKKPGLTAAYKFRYRDFERQSGSGYFDPQHFSSHQLLLKASAETGRLHGFVEPYYGSQSFARYGTRSSGPFYGGSGALGYAVRRNMSIELSGERGNNIAGTVSVFNYYLTTLRLTAAF